METKSENDLCLNPRTIHHEIEINTMLKPRKIFVETQKTSSLYRKHIFKSHLQTKQTSI